MRPPFLRINEVQTYLEHFGMFYSSQGSSKTVSLQKLSCAMSIGIFMIIYIVLVFNTYSPINHRCIAKHLDHQISGKLCGQHYPSLIFHPMINGSHSLQSELHRLPCQGWAMTKRKAWQVRLESRIDPTEGGPGSIEMRSMGFVGKPLKISHENMFQHEVL